VIQGALVLESRNTLILASSKILHCAIIDIETYCAISFV
jgi:hypothetical protein